MNLADDVAGAEAYGAFLKPRVAQLLRAVGLDVAYERAEGDYLYYRDASGGLVRVTDMLGGYGASLLGHNHPVLVERASAMFRQKRPFNAQASVRARAGSLAKRLSEIVGASTGATYAVTLASTGAAAVEAALKHAEMERVEKIDAELARNARVEKEVRMRRRAGKRVEVQWVDGAAQLLGDGPAPKGDDLFARVLEHNLDVLEAPPTFFTLQRGFHGKSTGALSITANPRYRKAWRRIGLRSVFLPAEDTHALERAVAEASRKHLVLSLDEGGVLRVAARELANVTACFVEPIQGEGGVREMSPAFLHALRRAADDARFPLVFDEIQCGMGRTGSFLASEPTGVRADYYLLSKSLGGGLAKISALLVDQRRYLPEFGLLHTSTFAEDDFSSTLALSVLDLLTENDGALVRGCAEKGAYLRERLLALKAKYPDQIVDVRGRGLMVGIEMASQTTSRSNFLRTAADQELLGYVLAGCLLHHHRIRIAPTLSSPDTLRIQPSAYVSYDELDRFCAAIEDVAVALREGQSARLVAHLAAVADEDTEASPSSVLGELLSGSFVRSDLVGKFLNAAERVQAALGETGTRAERLKRYLGERADLEQSRAPAPPARVVPAFGGADPSLATDRSVTFLAHFLEPSDLRAWDPTLASLSDEQCAEILRRSRDVLDPFILHRGVVRSTQGGAVGLTVVAIPFTSQQVMESFRKNDASWVRERIEKGVELAREQKSAVIGFGGYTSIMTNNCCDVLEDSAVLTSGNSVTAAAAIDALLAATARSGLARVRLGVVGAAGNIGTVLAEVLAENVDAIVLVGRTGAQARLERRAEALYASAWQLAETGVTTGIPGVLARSLAVRTAAKGPAGTLGARLRSALVASVGESREPIQVATDMAALRSCNAIVSATNAPKHVIFPEHVASGRVVLCDVATPGDVSPSVAQERPLAVLLKGGIVRLPLGQDLRIDGMQLPPGQIYGCLAETILLGLAGADQSLSLGPLTAAQIRRAGEIARAHGFDFEKRPHAAAAGRLLHEPFSCTTS